MVEGVMLGRQQSIVCRCIARCDFSLKSHKRRLKVQVVFRATGVDCSTCGVLNLPLIAKNLIVLCFVLAIITLHFDFYLGQGEMPRLNRLV